MTDRLHDALQVCLLAMETGVEREACLSLYPDLQDELQPALEAVSLARSAAVESVPSVAQMRSRTRMLERAARLGRRKGLGHWGMPRFALASVMVILLTFLGWSGLSAASAASLPGDTLYGVKRWGEGLRLNLALNPMLKDELAEDYRERRVDEVRKLLDLGRAGAVDFEGQLRRQDDTLWFVAEIPVTLDSNTRTVGSIEDGVIVEVRGTAGQEGGSVHAEQVVLRSLQFVGVVEEMAPEAWTIRGARIGIDAVTRIDPGIALQSLVLVRADVRADGGLVAQTILSLPEPTSPPLVPPAAAAATPHEQRLDDFEFHGTVESIGPDAWVIDGRPVKITRETEIGQDIRVGDEVRAEAFADLTGALTARTIERSGDTDEDVGEADRGGEEDDGSGSEEDDSVDDGDGGDEGTGNDGGDEVEGGS